MPGGPSCRCEVSTGRLPKLVPVHARSLKSLGIASLAADLTLAASMLTGYSIPLRKRRKWTCPRGNLPIIDRSVASNPGCVRAPFFRGRGQGKPAPGLLVVEPQCHRRLTGMPDGAAGRWGQETSLPRAPFPKSRGRKVRLGHPGATARPWAWWLAGGVLVLERGKGQSC